MAQAEPKVLYKSPGGNLVGGLPPAAFETRGKPSTYVSAGRARRTCSMPWYARYVLNLEYVSPAIACNFASLKGIKIATSKDPRARHPNVYD